MAIKIYTPGSHSSGLSATKYQSAFVTEQNQADSVRNILESFSRGELNVSTTINRSYSLNVTSEDLQNKNIVEGLHETPDLSGLSLSELRDLQDSYSSDLSERFKKSDLIEDNTDFEQSDSSENQ